MCSNLFKKKVIPAITKQEPTAPPVVAQPPTVVAPPVEVPAVTDTTSSPNAGLGLASARVAGAVAQDNVGVLAGEADVDVSGSVDPAEIDSTTGRRRPTRAAFMSKGRGGAGLRV